MIRMSAPASPQRPALSDLFSEANPAVAALPHLITLMDGELLGKVSQLTKSRPGLWPLPAPFDEEDRYNEVREAAKFADWALPWNQAEVQGVGRMVKEALFGANLILLDASVDEDRLRPFAQSQGRRLSNGAWFTPGYQDLPTLPQVVDLAGWVLIPVGPGRSRALFAASSARAEWVDTLRDWCDRQGRDTWKVTASPDGGVLEHRLAPERYRDNAIRHRLDAFLGEMELWFGDSQNNLAPRLQERIDHLRTLRENIARARQGS